MDKQIIAEQIAYDTLCECCHEHVERHLKDALLDAVITEVSRKRNPAIFALLERLNLPFERRMRRSIIKVWEKERRIIIANIKKTKKAWRTKDKTDELLYPKKKFVDEFNALFKTLMAEIMEKNADGAIEFAELDIAFDMGNPHVQKWLDTYPLHLSESMEGVNIEKLRRQLKAGIEAGEGIPELTKRVNMTYDNWNKARSEMIARTETLRASNQGALAAYRQSGVVTHLTWATFWDSRTCPFCEDLDGKTIGIEEKFFSMGDEFTVEREGKELSLKVNYTDIESPPLHARCLLPGTRCETAGNTIAGLRAFYRGKIIELSFSEGSPLTVTPNHMLLTPNGFASAQLLRKGDDIFYCSSLKGIIPGNPNNNNGPARIEDIISSFAKAPGMVAKRVPVSAEQLHGDGRFCDGYIDIIGADGFLLDTGKTAFTQFLREHNFSATDTNLFDLSRFSNLTAIFEALAFAADSSVGGSRQPHPFFLRRLAHSGEHSLASISGFDPILEQAKTNRTASNVKPFGECLLGLPAFIKTKKIVDIKIDSFHGYVYDLHTQSSLYISNGVISSNCRCHILPITEE